MMDNDACPETDVYALDDMPWDVTEGYDYWNDDYEETEVE